jgi:sigma-B regulation protein RsbU (phosphoserine phosphatase)
VSGKGIPAAMFMMTAKTIIKDLAESGLPVNEIFTKANQKLCENNESGMFVTAWMGIVDLTTGKMQFANAGHNPPLIGRVNGCFEYLRTRPSLVLAGMEGVKYRTGEITLCKGDRLFLYTDGVPEATNANNQLYNEDRLLAFMNGNLNLEATELLSKLKMNIDEFVDGAPQFDDITMLCFDFNPTKSCDIAMRKVFPAKIDSLPSVIEFVEKNLEEFNCQVKTKTSICVAIEEIFVNIARYAYGGLDGNVKFCMEFNKDTRLLTFKIADKGTKFNPLEKEDPDITLPAEERSIGGLGIFIAKKTMDLVAYAYENGENVLIMQKKI